THAEPSPGNAGNYLVFRLIRWLPGHAQCPQMLDSGGLVTGRAVVLRNFRLDDDLGIEFARDDEIGCLI
ncbi:MAG: hypothetical protein KKD24_03275, partial [Proteobacteria bacterium]|nr:hypothetical protein [Pseudomonadota bacterium]